MKDQENIADMNEGCDHDRYCKSISLVSTISVVIICLSCLLAYLTFFPSKSSYYATTTTGTVVKLHPLSEPVVNDRYLTQWASVAVRNAYNINFLNGQSNLGSVKQSFTNKGWQSFKDALDNSGLLKTVSEKKLVMTAIVSNDPIIVDRGIQYGHYIWLIQMPLLISFESASARSYKKMLATVVVERVPVLQDPLGGIEITRFSVKHE